MQAGDYEGALPLLEQAVAASGARRAHRGVRELQPRLHPLRARQLRGVARRSRPLRAGPGRAQRDHAAARRGRAAAAAKVTTSRRGGPRTAARSTRGSSPDLIGSHQARFSRYHADRRGEALRRARSAAPSRALAQLRRVERVAAVVPGAVLDVADERLGRRRCSSRIALRDLEVLALLAAADVVDLAGARPRAARARSPAQWSST